MPGVAILTFVALQSILFPIDQPIMPETRQIGREVCLDKLETKLDAAAHQWLIGERRIGKTSVAKAVLARLRSRGSVALDIDLSRLAVSTSEGLAGEVARQAQAAGVGAERPLRKKFLGIAAKHRPTTTELSGALNGLGFEEVSQALSAVSALLAGADGGAPGLAGVLDALALHARATEQRAYLLFDEVHLLGRLEDAEEKTAAQCREQDCPIVFLFAGSEESAVRRRPPSANDARRLPRAFLR